MNRMFVLLMVIFASLAAQAQTSDCLKKLSAGQNRFRASISLSALQEATRGLRKFQSQLSTTSQILLVDYTKNSKDKRAYWLDFKACDLLAYEPVIHGGAVYRPVLEMDGDPNNDGILDHCVNRHGTRKNMTRPGFMKTAGCHQTSLSGWGRLPNGCDGVKLVGLESRNQDVFDSGVVLHEHEAITPHPVKKPVGQGCPAFPIGRLSEIWNQGLRSGILVYLHAPQCDETRPSQKENL